MGVLDAYETQLDGLAADERRRSLIPQAGLDFSSNDYLGLAGSGVVRDLLRTAIDRGVPIGSGGSRLLRGNHRAHEELEQFAAAHFDSEAALYFSSGFAANAALFATLPQRGDVVLYDELVHASAHEGMRLGRAECRAIRHNDADSFAAACQDYRRSGGRGRIWIAVESLYSMDGDRAPVDALAVIADRHGAMLVVDEAHATGCFGTGGKGLSAHLGQRENLVTLRTCGKALGVEGGLLCLPMVLRDFMVNRARGFIFSTAPSPLMAALVQDVIAMLANDASYRDGFERLVAHGEARLGHFCPASARGSQIFPVMIGDNGRAMQLAAALQEQGFDVRGIRPPTVPQGTARLRISLSLNVDSIAIDALADTLDALGVEPLAGLAA
ncbi:MAG: 8-amino-7-oxononanoate synthase [Blastomonas sp.]